MNKQCDLDVRQVRNGWIVQERLSGGTVQMSDSIMVFNSFDAMCKFMKEHYKVTE